MSNYTFIAGEDLTGKIGYALKVDTGKLKVATVAGSAAFGILTNDNENDKAVSVALTGQICKAKLGGTVALGDALACDANGKLIVVADSAKQVAQALEAGASGDLIYVVVK